MSEEKRFLILLLQSANAEQVPVHMLFELGIRLFYLHNNHVEGTVSQWDNVVFCVFL